MDPSNDPPARLYLGPGLVLYLGPSVSAAEHRHHAIQIAWGLDVPLSVSRPDAPEQHARAVVIAADEPHAFEAQSGELAIALVEPEGARGRALDARARELEGRDVDAELALAGPPPKAPAAEPGEALDWCEELIAALLGDSPAPSSQPGEAVARALSYLERSIGSSPRLTEVAEEVGISPSRLTHRFSAEVGIPYRRYVLWVRIKRAVEELRLGSNLTEAAAAAGFSDQAHLTRTFRASFGLTPSRALAEVEIAGGIWDR